MGGRAGRRTQRPASGASSSAWQTNFVDLGGEQGLLGQTSGRRKKAVTDWLEERGQEWKDAVRVVAMDPCATYRSAISAALPNAIIVADQFHVIRLANQAVTTVRQRPALPVRFARTRRQRLAAAG